MAEVVDTFPRFLEYWQSVRESPFEAQVAGYRAHYLASWPELFEKQVVSYAEEGESWRAIARERIFPHLDRRLSAMQTAHENLRAILPPVLVRAGRVFACDLEAIIVLYVGLGLGAGWATEFAGRPAVLFGLENIAEENWQARGTLAGLAAHELGHLVHSQLRRTAGVPEGDGPWWQLYTEGFAQRCEQVILSRASWHMAESGLSAGWLAACEAQASSLAASFLRASDQGADARPFFGSWFEINGLKQTGYFLGQACVLGLERRSSLPEIATMSNWEAAMRAELLEISKR